MLSIPVPRKTGRNSSEGDGDFQFSTDLNIWKTLVDRGEPFNTDVDNIADVKFSPDTTRNFTFGRANDFKLGVNFKANAIHQVHLVWPGQNEDLLRQNGLALPQDAVYARLVIGAGAEVAANASFPVGPLSLTGGVTAGGSVTYERWMLRKSSTPALSLLQDLYGGIRLPQHIDAIEEMPGPGELLVTRFGGYLHLNAGLSWGYSVTGSRDLEINKLELDLAYKLRMMAAVNFGYSLAGDFQIEARRGAAPNWVRFVVRKSRESTTSLAADFGLDAEIDLKGLPASADEFLSKLLGVHADRALELFDKARRYTTLDELEKAAGKLLKGLVHKYSQDALGIVLSDSNLQPFLDRMRQITDAYAHLDRRILDLYHDVIEEQRTGISKILPAIDLILGNSTREQFIALSGTSDFAGAVDLLRRLYNERLFDVLQRNESFSDAVKLLQTARDFLTGTADAEVKKWIDLLRRELRLDDLMNQLRLFDSGEKIRAIADERLQGLVEALVGRAFERLANSDIDKLLGILRNNLDRIEKFKNEWYAQIRNAVKQSFQAKLHLAYTRSRKNQRLLDVEINLAHADGPGMARLAARGEFFEVLKRHDPEVVLIRQGFFTDELKNSGEVKVNVLGWGMNGIVTLLQQTEHAIEPQSGGLLHVYTSETYVERRKTSGWRFKEEVRSKFLIKAIAETFQNSGSAFRPYAADILKSMTASYNLLHRDEETKPAELSEYLRLAQTLGFLDVAPADYVRELQEECDGDLGEVNVSYDVRFGAEELGAAFHFSGDPTDRDGGTLGRLARKALREFMLRKYASMSAKDWLPRVAFAYFSPRAYDWHRAAVLKTKLKAVVLPAWFTGEKRDIEVGLTSETVLLVDRLFRFEDKLVEALLALDIQVDEAKGGKPIQFDALNQALLDLLGSAKDLGEYDASCFTAVLDSLIQSGSGGAGRRDSTMLLEVSPRKGKLAGQKVTRLLAIGPKTAAGLAEDGAAEGIVIVAAGAPGGG